MNNSLRVILGSVFQQSENAVCNVKIDYQFCGVCQCTMQIEWELCPLMNVELQKQTTSLAR